MKSIIKIILLTILIGVCITEIHAQRFDMDKMNQDLRISERILEELMQSNQREIAFFPSSARMNSLYVPEFGVIFDVNPPGFINPARIATINIRGTEGDSGDGEVHIVERDGSETRISGTRVASASSNPERNETTLAQTKDAIRNFLGSYADIIGQLSANESITVMVRASTVLAFRTPTPPPPPSGSSQPAVSVNRPPASKGYLMSVRKSDITALKTQRISKEEFDSRIRETEIVDSKNSDFEIFEKILETGLSGEQNKSFSLNRGLSRIYDEQLGLVILGSIRNSSVGPLWGAATSEGMNIPEFKEFEYDYEVAVRDTLVNNIYRFEMDVSPDSAKSRLQRLERVLKISEEEIRKGAEEIRRSAVELRRVLVGEARETRSKEEVLADFESFESEAKNLLLDYGRTLRSLRPDQVVILSLSQRRDIDGIPSRLVLSVKKSTLDAFDSRSITKDIALSQITVVRN
jgi:hypothetical protein